MSGDVDIPGDGEALAGNALLLVVGQGGEAGGLLDGAEQMVVSLGHEAGGLLQDALNKIRLKISVGTSIIGINQLLAQTEEI